MEETFKFNYLGFRSTTSSFSLVNELPDTIDNRLSFFKQKCELLIQDSQIQEFAAFLCHFFKVIGESLDFTLLVGQKKQLEDATSALGNCDEYYFTIFFYRLSEKSVTVKIINVNGSPS